MQLQLLIEIIIWGKRRNITSIRLKKYEVSFFILHYKSSTDLSTLSIQRLSNEKVATNGFRIIGSIQESGFYFALVFYLI